MRSRIRWFGIILWFYRMGIRHFITDGHQGALKLSDREIGRDLAETIEIVKPLEEAGYDGLSLDVGCYEGDFWSHPPYYQPHGLALDMPAEVKRPVNIPIIVAGRLDRSEQAEKAIADRKTDVIGLARGLPCLEIIMSLCSRSQKSSAVT